MYTLFPHCFPFCCYLLALVGDPRLGMVLAWFLASMVSHTWPQYASISCSVCIRAALWPCDWRALSLLVEPGIKLVASVRGHMFSPCDSPSPSIVLYKFRVTCWPCTHKIPAPSLGPTTVVPEYYRVWPTLSLVGTGSHWAVPCPTHSGGHQGLT